MDFKFFCLDFPEKKNFERKFFQKKKISDANFSKKKLYSPQRQIFK